MYSTWMDRWIKGRERVDGGRRIKVKVENMERMREGRLSGRKENLKVKRKVSVK